MIVKLENHAQRILRVRESFQMPGALSQKIASINNLQLQSGHIVEIGNVGEYSRTSSSRRGKSVSAGAGPSSNWRASLRSGLRCRRADGLFRGRRRMETGRLCRDDFRSGLLPTHVYQ